MSPVNIGVLISGSGTNLQAIIDNIENGALKGRVSLVISNKKDAYGLTRAQKHGIEALYLDKGSFKSKIEYDRKIIELMKSKNVELVILAGYLSVLSSEFINEFYMQIINIHPSLIPSFSGKGYYGDKVHQEVLNRGLKISGATVHFVDEGTDTGPIILQDYVRVEDDDNLNTLKKKVLEIEHKILVESVKLYIEDRLIVKNGKVSKGKVKNEKSSYKCI